MDLETECGADWLPDSRKGCGSSMHSALETSRSSSVLPLPGKNRRLNGSTDPETERNTEISLYFEDGVEFEALSRFRRKSVGGLLLARGCARPCSSAGGNGR